MECFSIYVDEIEGRLDPLYYSFSYGENFVFQRVVIKNLINYMKTGFAAGKSQQTQNQERLIQIRPTNIDEEGNLYFTKNIYLPPELKFTRNSDLLRKGEVLFNNTNSQELVGKSAYFDLDGYYFCSNHITRIGVRQDKLDPKYLWIILNYLQRKRLFYNICTNWNNQSGVNVNLLKKIKVPLPPLKIQNRIAQLMDNTYKIKKQKETEAKHLLNSINDYVLDELGIKLPELKDKICYVVYSDDVENNRCDAYYYQPKFEELEEAINKGKYEVKSGIYYFTNIESGKGVSPELKTDSGIRYLEVNHIKKLKILNSELYVSEINNLKTVDNNDLLTGRVGSIGDFVVFNKNEKIAFSDNVLRIKIKNEICSYFLASVLNSVICKYQIDRSKKGSLQNVINQQTLNSLLIPLPPLSIQNKIADEVKARMQKAEQLQKEAKEVLEEAKERVERIILGEEEI